MISLLLSGAFAAAATPAETLATLRASLGADALPAVRFRSEITHIDGGQSPDRDALLVVSRLVEQRSMAADGDQALSIEEQVHYPYVFPLHWTERIDAAAGGEIVGADTYRGDRHRPVSPARLALREKERLLAVPGWLLAELVPVETREEDGRLLLDATWQDGPVTLVLDPSGQRLDAVRFLEDLPPLGDVAVELRYQDWQGSPAIPTRVETWVDDQPAIVATRTAVERLDRFSVDPLPRPAAAPAESTLGWTRATWLTGWMGFGFPQDDAPLRFDLRWREVAPGVHLITGEFHNVEVVELGRGRLAIVDAPLSPELVEAVLAGVAERWPEGEVIAAFLTHHHLDHLGGVRALAERGVPLYVAEGDAAWLRELLRKPAILSGRSGASTAEVIGVTDVFHLEGADQRIEAHRIQNPHADDMLALYLPAADLLHVDDLLNPGLFPTRGPLGWVARRVIDGISPYNLAKAGLYAKSLGDALPDMGLDPKRITGGHGPQVAGQHAIRVLSRSADAQVTAAMQAADAWPSPQQGTAVNR